MTGNQKVARGAPLCQSKGNQEVARDFASAPKTRVELKLEATKNGTKLTITESGFNGIPDDKRRVDALRSNTQGWDIQAKNIATYVES
ncbi:MAG TPA: SRPBCC domain-containing protein [Gammaproteobacteria bacterium]|nr:SRPBCC domain-containing protein [Gammaproteobacteria bacterium]